MGDAVLVIKPPHWLIVFLGMLHSVMLRPSTYGTPSSFPLLFLALPSRLSWCLTAWRTICGAPVSQVPRSMGCKCTLCCTFFFPHLLCRAHRSACIPTVWSQKAFFTGGRLENFHPNSFPPYVILQATLSSFNKSKLVTCCTLICIRHMGWISCLHSHFFLLSLHISLSPSLLCCLFRHTATCGFPTVNPHTSCCLPFIWLSMETTLTFFLFSRREFLIALWGISLCSQRGELFCSASLFSLPV